MNRITALLGRAAVLCVLLAGGCPESDTTDATVDILGPIPDGRRDLGVDSVDGLRLDIRRWPDLYRVFCGPVDVDASLGCQLYLCNSNIPCTQDTQCPNVMGWPVLTCSDQWKCEQGYCIWRCCAW